MQYHLSFLKDKLEKFKNLILKPFYKLQILEYTTNSNPQELKRLTRRNNRKIKKILFTANILLFLIPYTFFSYNIYRNRYLTTSKIVIRIEPSNAERQMIIIKYFSI